MGGAGSNILASGAVWTAAYHDDESWGIENLIVVLNGAAADYNRNGIVDAADYLVSCNSLEQAGSRLAADGNGDGAIDVGDYDLWRSDFGKTAIVGAGANGSSSDPAAVPEPSTALLLALTAAVGYMKRQTAQRVSELDRA